MNKSCDNYFLFSHWTSNNDNRQKGNLDCKLLEPVDKTDDFISMTVWENEDDANAYHSSGVYKQLVDRVRDSFAKNPVLKVYSAENVMEPA